MGKIPQTGKVSHKNSVGGARAAMDLIVTKYIAIEGTSIIAMEFEDKLLDRFSTDFVRRCKDFDKLLSVKRERTLALEFGAAVVHEVTEGGIFGALWEMAEASGVGIEADRKAIPIRQETIELCEFFDIDPYRLTSRGCVLIATKDCMGIVRLLSDNGIESAVIGRVTDNNDRVIIADDRRSFLTPPK